MSQDTITSITTYLRTVRAVRASVEPEPTPCPYALGAAHYSQQAATEREGRLRAERRARFWRSAMLNSAALALGIYGTKVVAAWPIVAGVALVVAAIWMSVTEG